MRPNELILNELYTGLPRTALIAQTRPKRVLVTSPAEFVSRIFRILMILL